MLTGTPLRTKCLRMNRSHAHPEDEIFKGESFTGAPLRTKKMFKDESFTGALLRTKCLRDESFTGALMRTKCLRDESFTSAP